MANLKIQPPKEVGGHEFEKVEGCWSCLKRKQWMYAAEKLVISPNGDNETNLKYFKASQEHRTENQNPCLGHHCGRTKVQDEVGSLVVCHRTTKIKIKRKRVKGNKGEIKKSTYSSIDANHKT